MKDFIPKGTGDSRYLKSAIPADITHEQLVALLRTGTFPIDLAGVNPDGVAQRGDALNKGNLLTDDTARDYGVGIAAVPDDVFKALLSAFRTNSAYSSDLYLYIIGKHPILNASIYNDYGQYEQVGDHSHGSRSISTSGTEAKVYDAFKLDMRF